MLCADALRCIVTREYSLRTKRKATQTERRTFFQNRRSVCRSIRRSTSVACATQGRVNIVTMECISFRCEDRVYSCKVKRIKYTGLDLVGASLSWASNKAVPRPFYMQFVIRALGDLETRNMQTWEGQRTQTENSGTMCVVHPSKENARNLLIYLVAQLLVIKTPYFVKPEILIRKKNLPFVAH